MIQQFQLVLAPPTGVRVPQAWAYRLYGWLMAQLPADVGDALHLQVALDVWNAYQNLATATQTIRTTADLLASAEQSERVALGRYKAGVGNILDVLNSQSALAAARMQRIQAMLDWRVSRATLAKAVGSILNER